MLLLALPLAVTGYVFRGLPNLYFYRDDFLNLLRIVDDPTFAYLLRPHGGHLLLARNSLFYLFYSAFGTDAAWYFRIVLATHLLNVYLLFRVVQRVTGSRFLASFGAALWGICPLHWGTLGWYSVYGQVVVCTIMLFLLDRAAGRSREDGDVARRLAIRWTLLLLLAATSFGTGIGIALVAPIVFFLILPPSRARTWVCATSGALAVSLPFLYRAALWLYASTFGAVREVLIAHLMFHRTVTRAGILLVRAGPMFGSLFAFGLTGLVLSSADTTQAWPDSRALIVSALCATVVLVATILSSPRQRRWLIASLLLAIACYGIITMGRATTKGVMPTELRYHYVALAAVTLALCVALAQYRPLLRPIRFLRLPLLLVWAALAIHPRPDRLPPHALGGPAERNEVEWILSTIELHALTAPTGSDVYIENKRFNGAGLLINRGDIFPGYAGIFAIYSPSNTLKGRRVFFVERDPGVLPNAKGKRSSILVVTPARAAAAEKMRKENAPATPP